MKKVSRLLGLFTVAAFAGGAFATTIVCTETKPRKGGDYERFTITLDGERNLVAFDDANGGAGYGPISKTKEKSLKPKVTADDLTYHYKYQDEGDGDYPGPKEDWFITIPKSGRGPGHVGTSYDQGDGGRDDYKLDCK